MNFLKQISVSYSTICRWIFEIDSILQITTWSKYYPKRGPTLHRFPCRVHANLWRGIRNTTTLHNLWNCPYCKSFGSSSYVSRTRIRTSNFPAKRQMEISHLLIVNRHCFDTSNKPITKGWHRKDNSECSVHCKAQASNGAAWCGCLKQALERFIDKAD